MRDLFLDNAEVLSHRKNNGSGFSATVFKNIKNDEVVFANRGTSISDLSDIHADVDIVNSGVPQEQVVDLYDYFKELVTPETEKYQKAIHSSVGIRFEESQNLGKGYFDSFNRVDTVGRI